MIRCIRKPGITGYIQSDDFFSLTVTLALGYTHEARDQASFVHLSWAYARRNGVIHGKSIRNLLFQHDIDVIGKYISFSHWDHFSNGSANRDSKSWFDFWCDLPVAEAEYSLIRWSRLKARCHVNSGRSLRKERFWSICHNTVEHSA